jgi:hypothetical protein
MDDVFNVIGKLYVDVYNSQKIIELLQKEIRDKNQEIEELKLKQATDE